MTTFGTGRALSETAPAMKSQSLLGMDDLSLPETASPISRYRNGALGSDVRRTVPS